MVDVFFFLIRLIFTLSIRSSLNGRIDLKRFWTFSVQTVRRGNYSDKTRLIWRNHGHHRKRVGWEKEKNATDTESTFFLRFCLRIRRKYNRQNNITFSDRWSIWIRPRPIPLALRCPSIGNEWFTGWRANITCSFSKTTHTTTYTSKK